MIFSNVLLASLLASALQTDAAHSSFQSSHARRSLAIKRDMVTDLLRARDLGDLLGECSIILLRCFRAPFVACLLVLCLATPALARSHSSNTVDGLVVLELIKVHRGPVCLWRQQHQYQWAVVPPPALTVSPRVVGCSLPVSR